MFSLQNIFVKQLTQKGSLRQFFPYHTHAAQLIFMDEQGCPWKVFHQVSRLPSLPFQDRLQGAKVAKAALARPFTRCRPAAAPMPIVFFLEVPTNSSSSSSSSLSSLTRVTSVKSVSVTG